MDIQKPFLCCIICRKETTFKGLSGHIFSKHDPVGIERMKQVRSMGTDASFRKQEFQDKIQEKREEVKPPKIINFCPQCNKEATPPNKFCSHSCSATYGNLRKPRKPKGIKKPQAYKKKPPKPLKTRVCTDCGKVDTTKARFQSTLCSSCNDGPTYRFQCNFKFNLGDHPTEFDFTRLTEVGMFNPLTNTKGLSRDHMFSVWDGKALGVDPKILSHPANCVLMTQSDNTKKHKSSSISLDELLERIRLWDIKYPKV